VSWTAALAHFAGCLEDGTAFETDGLHNLKTMRMVFAAIESAETGQPVHIAEIGSASPKVCSGADDSHKGVCA
jgi:hypothetical protein